MGAAERVAAHLDQHTIEPYISWELVARNQD